MESSVFSDIKAVMEILFSLTPFRVAMSIFIVSFAVKTVSIFYRRLVNDDYGDYDSVPCVEHESATVTISVEAVEQVMKKCVPEPVEEKLSDFFWECPYCDSLNDMHEPVCPHCNAPRMKMG